MESKLPQAFIFMRVGNHAGESFASILARKQREVEQAGKIFWGYGGTTLHPVRHVQPFAKLWVQKAGSIQIVMEPIDSHANPDVLPAKEYSIDGIDWQPLPSGIVVTGSRYAVVLDEIKPGQLDLDLGQFEVGVGPSRGRNAAEYIQGRVDKGCFVATSRRKEAMGGLRKVEFRAHLIEPYAVLLR
jgi:hypothetical protein